KETNRVFWKVLPLLDFWSLLFFCFFFPSRALGPKIGLTNCRCAIRLRGLHYSNSGADWTAFDCFKQFLRGLLFLLGDCCGLWSSFGAVFLGLLIKDCYERFNRGLLIRDRYEQSHNSLLRDCCGAVLFGTAH
ncbi:LOW QUALITY PROTEIN: hypothetical protein TorRG33x02_097650, partial [Trema orientale]